MLYLAFILLVMSAAFYLAGNNAYHGIRWIDRLCEESQGLCNDPGLLLAMAALVIVLGVAIRILRPKQ
jgi:preprotein translocase subunit Sec61beta